MIAGAVLRTLDFIAAGAAEFVGYLEKGQLPPAKLTLTTARQSFVLEGVPAVMTEDISFPRQLSASNAVSSQQLCASDLQKGINL